MGLDMYLQKVTYEEKAYWRKANAIHNWFDNKFNERHGRELENCEQFFVEEEDLIELRNLCQTVLDKSVVKAGLIKNGERLNPRTNKWEPIYEEGEYILNPEVAMELLPTTSGFFFGQTEYDQYYLEDLKSTIEQINNILETTDFDNEQIAYSAWW